MPACIRSQSVVLVTEIDVETPGPRPRPPSGCSAPPFNWRQIESPDYKTYIANLKGVQCPAATIRDIIVADVDDQYTHKRTQILAARQAEFWNASGQGWKGHASGV